MVEVLTIYHKNEEKKDNTMPNLHQGLGYYYPIAENILLGLVRLIHKINPNISTFKW